MLDYLKEREERKERALKLKSPLFTIVKYEEVYTHSLKLKDIVEFSNDIPCRLSIDKDGNLEIFMNVEEYNKPKKHNVRKAGRKRKSAYIPGEVEQHIDHRGETWEMNKAYRYADIVYMMQTMKDKDIMSKLNMTQSTYYRRKKDMKNSDYFGNLDKNRLDDKEYLESLPGNSHF